MRFYEANAGALTFTCFFAGRKLLRPFRIDCAIPKDRTSSFVSFHRNQMVLTVRVVSALNRGISPSIARQLQGYVNDNFGRWQSDFKRQAIALHLQEINAR